MVEKSPLSPFFKGGVSIIFMGTPEFAVPSLEAVHSKFEVKAVVTVPDKPRGRGQSMIPSPVKIKALELGLPVLQPEKLTDEDFIRELTAYKPDIIAVIAFRILPRQVYTLAKIASFNIHASLLPKYRGAAPINWAIINGEKTTGLTSFLLRDKVDTGDILLQEPVKIPDGATAGDLHDILMPKAAGTAIQTIEMLLLNKYTPLAQNDNQATPAPKLFKEQCNIDWNIKSFTVKNFINGVSPVPGAWTLWEGINLRVLRAESLLNESPEILESEENPGSYLITNDKFIVKCREGFVLLNEIQLPGKKAVKTQDFIRGWRGVKTGNFINSKITDGI